MDTTTLVNEVLAAEGRRCEAIGNRDRDALAATVADDLRYLHSTGFTEDKDAYLETSVGGVARRIERGELTVRILGPEAAAVLGDYDIVVDDDPAGTRGYRVEATGLQVWVRNDAGWQLWAHQGTVRQ